MAEKDKRDKGEGSIYQRADGRYVGALTLAPGLDGKRRRKVVYGKTAAEALAKLQKARRDQKHLDARLTRSPTLDEWAKQDFDAAEVDGRLTLATLKGHRSRYATTIGPCIGKMRLDTIRPAHVNKALAFAREQGLGPSSRYQIYMILSGLLKRAVRMELIDDNPCAKVERPRKGTYEAQALTAPESVRLLDWAEGHAWYDLRVSLALMAGCRSGELLGLTRQAVDLDAGTIDVTWQLQRLAPGQRPADTRRSHHIDGNYWLLELKADSARYGVPLLPRLHDLLTQRLAKMSADPWALVFTGERGGPISHERDWALWREGLTAADVPAVRRHDSRHTCATLLREAGVDPRIIQAILGHTTAAMTARYSHLGPRERAEAIGKLGLLLESAAT